MLPENRAFLFGTNKIAKAIPSPKGRHTFGGATQFRGATREDCDGLLVHQLYCFDLAESVLPFHLSGLKWLPLFYCFDFRINTIGYRLTSDDSLQFFFERSHPSVSSNEEWPYDNYPREFPKIWLNVVTVPYDPQNVDDAYAWAGVLGIDSISAEGEEQLRNKAIDAARLWGHEAPGTREELAEYLDMPFVQGRPSSQCMNPACDNSKKEHHNQLHVIAIVPNAPLDEALLFGKYEDDVILIFQICERCQTIRVSNQCT